MAGAGLISAFPARKTTRSEISEDRSDWRDAMQNIHWHRPLWVYRRLAVDGEEERGWGEWGEREGGGGEMRGRGEDMRRAEQTLKIGKLCKDH